MGVYASRGIFGIATQYEDVASTTTAVARSAVSYQHMLIVNKGSNKYISEKDMAPIHITLEDFTAIFLMVFAPFICFVITVFVSTKYSFCNFSKPKEDVLAEDSGIKATI